MSETIFNKSIVVFAAHPDDTEIFMAGTLKLLSEKGWRITVVTGSAGGMGGIGTTEPATIKTRKSEAKSAAALLGAEYYCLDGRDGFLYDIEKMRLKAIEIIRAAKAGVVLTHLPSDYHTDHRAMCSIADAATMLSSLPNVPSKSPPLPVTPVFYHAGTMGLTDPLGNKMTAPHFFVNITSTQDFKMQMLAQHQSQIHLMKHMFRMDDFFGEMKKQDIEWGSIAGCPFAEAYWQHRGSGFPSETLLQEELKEYIIIK